MSPPFPVDVSLLLRATARSLGRKQSGQRHAPQHCTDSFTNSMDTLGSNWD